MLKIKDDVDLKELEKCGLEYLTIEDYDEEELCKAFCAIDEDEKEFYIDDIKARKIDRSCVQFFIDKNREISYCTYPEERSETFILDKIYDLTQAGFVEKVEE